MKKSILFFLVMFQFFTSQAQSNKNTFEVGKNFYHFSNTGWDGLFEVNLGYTRKLNNEKFALRFGSGFFLKEYSYSSEVESGNVFDRYFFLFEATVDYSILKRERSSFNIHFGPLYRQGTENQVVNLIDRGVWTDVVINEFSNSGFGVLLASSYRYFLSERLSMKGEVGAQQFFQKEGTPFSLYGGLKIGYSF